MDKEDDEVAHVTNGTHRHSYAQDCLPPANYVTLLTYHHNLKTCASSRPIQSIGAQRVALPPPHEQKLQKFEENEHNNTGTKRHREVVHVQRSEPEKSAREWPKQR